MSKRKQQRLRAREKKPRVFDRERLDSYIARLEECLEVRRASVDRLKKAIEVCEQQMSDAESRIRSAQIALDLLAENKARDDIRVVLEWTTVSDCSWTVTGVAVRGWRVSRKIGQAWKSTRLRTEKGKPRSPATKELKQVVTQRDLSTAVGLRDEIEQARKMRNRAAGRLRRIAGHIFGPGAVIARPTEVTQGKRDAMTTGQALRRFYVCEMMDRIDRMLALIERCETDIDDRMFAFNITGPCGFQTLVCRWRVSACGPTRMSIPEGPEWAVIWRYVPGVKSLGSGYRGLKKIARPTRAHVRAGQLGKYGSKLMALRDSIELKAKRRTRLLRRLSAAYRVVTRAALGARKSEYPENLENLENLEDLI